MGTHPFRVGLDARDEPERVDGLPDRHGLQDVTWLRVDGSELHGDEWRRPDGRAFGCLIGRPGRCAVPLPSGGERFAGWFSLMPMQPAADAAALGVQPGDVELGSRLLPEHWGSGLSLLGGETLLRHAFERQRVRAVWGVCHPDHHPARACLQALGFSPRGTARYEGQPSDHHALAAADWAALQPLSHRERLRRQRRAAAPLNAAPA